MRERDHPRGHWAGESGKAGVLVLATLALSLAAQGQAQAQPAPIPRAVVPSAAGP